MPPRTVRASVAVHACSYVLGFAHAFVTGGLPDTVIAVVLWLLVCAVIYVYLRALYRGNNVIRWLSIALSTIGVMALPWSLAGIPTVSGKVVYVIQGVLIAVAGVLLLVRSSSQWYRRSASVSSAR